MPETARQESMNHSFRDSQASKGKTFQFEVDILDYSLV